MQQHLMPWMVGSAYRCLTAAKHLKHCDNMLPIAQTNAALGMEILLKSFVSKPNGNLGQVFETYELDYNAIKAAHENLKAADRIPTHRKNESADKHDLMPRRFHQGAVSIRERCLERFR